VVVKIRPNAAGYFYCACLMPEVDVMNQKRNTKKGDITKFLVKATARHGSRYDYGKSVYIGVKTKLIITCHKHGDFTILPDEHYRGQGCPKCGIESCARKHVKNTDWFIKQALLLYKDKYDYSKFVYVRWNIKGTIICKIHGEFMEEPCKHLRGRECPLCVKRRQITFRYFSHGRRIVNRYTREQFIAASIMKHGNKYSYDDMVYKKGVTMVAITCKRHGVFGVKLSHHLAGRGCPICRESTGETAIRVFLSSIGVWFKPQCKFKACHYKRALPFDFCIKYRGRIFLVEFQGIHHYRRTKPVFGKGLSAENAFNQLAEVKLRDRIKRDWCKKHGIPLLRIPYWRRKDIPALISKFIGYSSILQDFEQLTIDEQNI
jgi:hypothetical protein